MLYTNVHNFNHSSQNEASQVSIGGGMDSMVNLEDLMLGEISQARKDRPCTVLLTKGPRMSRPETYLRGAGWVFTWTELAFGRWNIKDG